jgi:hypothetical protein
MENMANNFIIECPKCEWQPDGKPHWSCSCGHTWNTFDTKGKCPSCNKQWEVTYCPGCGHTSTRKDWYIDPAISKEEEEPGIEELKRRKRIFERRMTSLGINKYRIVYLKYLDPTDMEFRSPYEVGCRLLILYSVAYCVHHLKDRQKIIDWFKREELWDKVSRKEKAFLSKRKPDQKELQGFSWRLEGALTLGWALSLVDSLHEIDRDETDEEMQAFVAAIPKPEEGTKEFLGKLSYRNLEQIYEENLVNELVTAYFRDLYISGGKEETPINRMASYERHRTLNWVRQFSGVADWDETDTST